CIEPVQNTPRERKQFILFPFRHYRDDPNWVPPLIGERMVHLDPARNPFFQHAEMQMFRAVRDGRIIGTIAAIADETHPRIWNESVGFFGLFECIDDERVAAGLFDAARSWLAERGREIMRGPMNLNINDEIGLLIQGFDGPPMIMMTYNPPYYQRLMEGYGLQKVKDLFAYYIDVAGYGRNLENMPEQVTRVARIAQERYHVTMCTVDLKNLQSEIELIKPIYREAWARNWSAIPMTDAEFDYLADNLKAVIDPDLTYIAFIDDKPIGVFLAVPDYCEVAIHMGGRLFPIGWAKYLWYRRKIKGLRVMIMGVQEEHRLKGVESLFYQEGVRTAVNKGYTHAEMSWILEDNYKVRRGIEMMGGRHYRTYRMYDIPTSAG
ncbi:MAG TPA: N-acetyltransferase, partial [Chloroflexi bacterium]|nr:N-acetyltransferase [Chloroflexota bacterium]